MAKKRTEDTVSDAEVERRATEALRRALATPYKPQRAVVGSGKKNRTRPQKKRS